MHALCTQMRLSTPKLFPLAQLLKCLLTKCLNLRFIMLFLSFSIRQRVSVFVFVHSMHCGILVLWAFYVLMSLAWWILSEFKFKFFVVTFVLFLSEVCNVYVHKLTIYIDFNFDNSFLFFLSRPLQWDYLGYLEIPSNNAWVDIKSFLFWINSTCQLFEIWEVTLLQHTPMKVHILLHKINLD